jgi:hypothetical protein
MSNTGMGKPQAITLAVVVVVLALLFFLIGRGEGDSSGKAAPVLVCIDSTVSTDDVRGKYAVDLEAVARRAAYRQAHFYAAACGANATGEVDWPVHRKFRSTYTSDALSKEQLEHQADQVIEGTQTREGVSDLLEVVSHDGTPVGEMLAVTARQCEQAGGSCAIYLFTDGEWADGLLRIRDEVSEQERKRYLETYVPRLSGLEGSTVNFVGVGLGTVVGELRLAEAKEIAEELIEEAGGKMGFWTTRL